MLEILAIIFLSKSIGELADKKGLKRGTWRLYMVLAWIGAELLGIVLVMAFMPDSLLVAILVGYGLAISSYFILKSKLNKYPNAGLNHDINQIGRTSEPI